MHKKKATPLAGVEEAKKLLEKDKERRAQEFSKELQALMQKFNVEMTSQIVVVPK
jgi:hypothetical protein